MTEQARDDDSEAEEVLGEMVMDGHRQDVDQGLRDALYRARWGDNGSQRLGRERLFGRGDDDDYDDGPSAA